MRVPRAGLLALGLLAALPGPGAAAPCSPAFDSLLPEVELRAHLVRYPATSAQKAEKRALAKVLRTLERKSTSYRKDARAAGTVGRALLDLYPSSTPIQDLLQGSLDGLRADLGRERDDLVLTAGQLPAGAPKDAALAGVAAADLALAADDGAPVLDMDARPLALESAAKSMEKAFRSALPGRDGKRRRTCGDEMWVQQGGALLWRADLVTGIYQESSNQFFLSGIRARGPADDSQLDLVVENVFGVGTYSLGFGSGTWRDTFIQFGIVEGGTLTITAIDKVKGTASGTFAFRARGCLFDCSTYQVTGGVFRLRNLKVL